MRTRVIRTEFFTTQDKKRSSITIELPIGIRTEISRELALKIDEEMREKYPEIRMSNFTVGQADSDNTFGSIQDNGTHILSFNISLSSVGERERGLVEICEMIRQDLKKYSEIKTYEVLAGGSSGGAGGQSTVDVEIYGYDFAMTDSVANNIARMMTTVEGCTNAPSRRSTYHPE